VKELGGLRRLTYGLEIIGQESKRNPSIAECDGAFERAACPAANPDLNGTWNARWFDDESRDVEMCSVELWLTNAPS
jgi:hypothetical protein